jgi:hypothetical protein
LDPLTKVKHPWAFIREWATNRDWALIRENTVIAGELMRRIFSSNLSKKFKIAKKVFLQNSDNIGIFSAQVNPSNEYVIF